MPELVAGTTLARGFSGSVRPIWPLVRAGDLFELRYGKALVEGNRRSGLVPVFGTNGQCGWHDTLLFKGPGVILGRKGQGPLGVEWSESDYWVIDTAYSLSIRHADVDLRFAYYLIKYVGLNHLKDGTSNPSLSRDTFSAQALPIPPHQDQRRIADLLRALDDKIELNRRMRHTLEAMARTLFKSWFIDFDPVRVKMTTGAGPRTNIFSSLFSNVFHKSEFGEIPAGWRAVPLGELFALQRGTTYESRLLGRAGPVLLGLGTIQPGGGFRSERLKTYGGECPPNLILKPGDIYVALKGATKDGSMVGSIARVPPSVASGRLTQDTVKLVFKSPRSGIEQYIYWALQTQHYRDYCAARATGSAQVGLRRADFLSYRVVLPSEEVLTVFGELCDALTARTSVAEAESAELAAIRDTLLPKLLSGELRIRDAQRDVEKVA